MEADKSCSAPPGLVIGVKAERQQQQQKEQEFGTKTAVKQSKKRALGSSAGGDGQKGERSQPTSYTLRTSLVDEKDVDDECLLVLEAIHKALYRSKRLVVVVGAGISVQAGIPDFRSANGLFRTVKKGYNLKGSGQSMFDSSVYSDAESTAQFHLMVNSLFAITSTSPATKFHHMLSRIATENRLLRLYTQNVDCLELSLSGLGTAVPLPSKAPWPKTIQLHGGLKTMVCAKCGWTGPFDPAAFGQTYTADCVECRELDDVRAVVGKRKQGIGKLRPRIVLYNEFNPDGEAIGSVTATDLRSRPDALLVVGTSLRIPGVRRIVKEMAGAVHSVGGSVIWLNEEEPPAIKMLDNVFDYKIKGDCQVLPDILERYSTEFASAGKKLAAKRRRVTAANKTKTNSTKQAAAVAAATAEWEKLAVKSQGDIRSLGKIKKQSGTTQDIYKDTGKQSVFNTETVEPTAPLLTGVVVKSEENKR